MAAGAASHACRRGSGSTRGFDFFCLGGFFCVWTESRCRSMCWPVDRPATHAAAGAAARGALIFCFGDSFAVGLGAVAGACVGRGSGSTRGFDFFCLGGFFCVWTESRCRSMCWPVDRPATHAAAGAAARGALIFCFGDSFAVGLRAVAGACVGRGSGQPRMPPQERQHEGFWGLGDCFTRSGAAARGVRGRLEGSCTCFGATRRGLMRFFEVCTRDFCVGAAGRWGWFFWRGNI